MPPSPPFKDHFSAVADAYERHRPTYPEELYAALAGAAPATTRAWDCGCGSGQASRGLARHFDQVVATDASPEQIASARAHPKVSFRVAAAESSGLETASCDLVLVAQAAHWFDLDAFYAEARRIGRKGCLLAIVGYGLPRINAAIDALIDPLYSETLAAYWPDERRHIDTAYAELPFPFADVAPPIPLEQLSLVRQWTADDLLGYLGTWSSVSRYRAQQGSDPLAPFARALRAAFGSAPRPVRWPLLWRAAHL